MASLHGSILQLSASRGGVPKHAVQEAVITKNGLNGDAQADRRAHGGPKRAVCLFAAEIIDQLRADGHDIFPGATGENVTVRGLDWKRVVPGARLRLGDRVLVEVTEFAAPCWKNARWFKDGDFNCMNEKVQQGHSRVYVQVLEEGILHPGDAVTLLDENAADRAERVQPKTFRWKPGD